MNDKTAAQGADTGNQPEGSAPQNKDATMRGGQVEAPPKQNGRGQAGLLREVFTLREKKRERDEELSQIRSELESIKASRSAGSDSPRKVDPIEDPDGYRQTMREEARAEARRELTGLLDQHRVDSSAVQAEKWLLSRSHLQEDSRAGDEVARIIVSDYGNVVKADPRAAARAAYLDWCESKGVNPDMQGPSPRPNTNIRQTGVGNGSSDKVITSKDVSQMMNSAKTPEDRNRIAQEVNLAVKEGRFKGAVIRL